MAEATVYQLLGRVRSVTGHVITIKPYETILGVDFVNDDHVVIQMRCAEAIERRNGWEVKATGLRMISLKRTTKGKWDKKPITAWDDKPDHDFIRNWGRSTTVAEYHERSDWETICHRPGTPSAPMDNESRTREHADMSTPRMKRHWKVNV